MHHVNVLKIKWMIYTGDTDDLGCSRRHRSQRTQNRWIQTCSILLGMDDVSSIVEPMSSLVWADVIPADFQRFVSRYLLDISTYLSCGAQRLLRTIFMQNSMPKYACLPSKIVKVWIHRFCVCYDWWRRLQPMSSVPLVWYNHNKTKNNTTDPYAYLCLSGKLWYLQHICVGDTIVYH